MKKTKRILSMLLTLVMALSLTIPAFAATIVVDVQDKAVLELTSDGNEVTYEAVTVEGGVGADGVTYPDVTTYTYFIMLPAGSASLKDVPVHMEYAGNRTLKIDGELQRAGSSGERKISDVHLDFSDGAKTFQIYEGETPIRSFVVSAGINGTTLAAVYIRINVQNAIAWASFKDHQLEGPSERGLRYIQEKCGMTGANGDMGTVVITGLPVGSTAMDALYYLCQGTAGVSGVEMKKAAGGNIEASGLGIDLDGTGCDDHGHYTYISAMGNAAGDSWLGEFSTENLSGWLYLDRGKDGRYTMPNYGASQYILTGGDNIVWMFTNNYGDFDILNPDKK